MLSSHPYTGDNDSSAVCGWNEGTVDEPRRVDDGGNRSAVCRWKEERDVQRGAVITNGSTSLST